jgi:hypothetical protein
LTTPVWLLSYSMKRQPFVPHRILASLPLGMVFCHLLLGAPINASPPNLGHRFLGTEFKVDPPVAIPAAGNTPAVAWNGAVFLSVWARSGIYGARLDAEGNLLDPFKLHLNPTGAAPAVATNGREFIVVWEDPDGIIAAVVNAEGNLSRKTTVVSAAPGHPRARRPAIFGDGRNYLVVWQEVRGETDQPRSRIYGTRLTGDGEVLDPGGFLIGDSGGVWQEHPRVASNGEIYFVIWQATPAIWIGFPPYEIFAARVSLDGAVVDEPPLAIGSDLKMRARPDIASNGIDFLAVWQQGPDSRFARLGADGTTADPEGRVIETKHPAIRATVTGHDGRYMLLWEERNPEAAQGTVFGAELNPDIPDLQPPFPVGQTTSEPRPPDAFLEVASTGRDLFAVWQSGVHRDSRIQANIMGAMIIQREETLSVLPEFTVSQRKNPQQRPAIAVNGANYLLVWQDSRNLDTGWDIYGLRLDVEGNRLDPEPLVIANSELDDTDPAVASNGSDYLVVWSTVLPNEETEIRGRRIDGNGVMLDPAPLRFGLDNNPLQAALYSPAVASLGEDYLVVWTAAEENPSGTGFEAFISSVRGTVVRSDGTILTPEGRFISSSPKSASHPAVASSGSEYLVVWHDRRHRPDTDLYGARLSAEGDLLGGDFPVTVGEQFRQFPVLAGSADGYFAVWEDFRNGGSPDIYGARITTSGTVLDPEGIIISDAPGRLSAPTLTLTGQSFFAAWQDARATGSGQNLYAAEITPEGILVGETDFPVSFGLIQQPAIAAMNTDVLVVYLESSRLRGRLLSLGAGRITNPKMADQVFSLSFIPSGEGQYIIEVSSDLRQWKRWTDSSFSSSPDEPPVKVVDHETGGSKHQFYRFKKIDDR